MLKTISERTIAWLKEEILSLALPPFDLYIIDSRRATVPRAEIVAKEVESAWRANAQRYRHTLDELDREVQALEDSYREATRHLLHVRGTLAEARREEEISLCEWVESLNNTHRTVARGRAEGKNT